MAMQYKEVPQGAPKAELRKYAKGIRLVDGLVDSLAAEGLLPPRFGTARTTLRGTETAPILPEGAIYLPDIQTRGMSNEQMKALADSRRELHIGDWARQGLQRGAVSSAETLTLGPVVMDAHTMEPSATYPTTRQLQKRALEFGDEGSIEAMLQLAILAAEGKIQVEIGKPLIGITSTFTDSDGDPRVLCLERVRVGLWLDASDADSGRQWDPGSQVVIFPRK